MCGGKTSHSQYLLNVGFFCRKALTSSIPSVTVIRYSDKEEEEEEVVLPLKQESPPQKSPPFTTRFTISLSLFFSISLYSVLKLEQVVVVATTRWLSSDSGAFTDWVASSSIDGLADDLSLGFNAGPSSAGGGDVDAGVPVAPQIVVSGSGGGGSNSGGGGGGGIWSSSVRSINYNLPVLHEMGVVGLRSDVLFVAPASSFHHLHHDSFISDHHHQNQNNHQSINNGNNSSTSATTLGIGGIPLLSSSTTPCGDGSSQLWQNFNNYPNKKPILINQENSPNLINNNNPSFGSTISSTRTCQDCGNQAKKDCSHSRCRTCCKSHGYDCSTHVKSTWISAARRRDRLPVASADQPDAGGGAGSIGRGGGSCGPTSAVKKPRLVTSQTSTTPSHTSTSTPPRSVDTTSSHHQDASFREALPRQVLAPASFKCVRVTSISDGEDEIAYQAIVKIGGHVFKGFLYNKGLNLDKGLPDIAKLHLSGEGGDGGGRNWASSSSLMVDPSNVYATSGSGLLGSGDLKSSFFSHLRIQ